jgi:hypothetical protein
VDLLYFHDALHECSLRAVGMAALSGAFPPGLGARAVDVIAARAAAGAVPPAQWHSLLAALLLGSMSGGERRPSSCLAGSWCSAAGTPSARQLHCSRRYTMPGRAIHDGVHLCDPTHTSTAGSLWGTWLLTARRCNDAAWRAGVPAEASWGRHRTILDAACRALGAFGSTGAARAHPDLHRLSLFQALHMTGTARCARRLLCQVCSRGSNRHESSWQTGHAGDSWRLVEPLLLAQVPAQADRRRALYGVLRGAATALAANASAAAAQHGALTAPASRAAVPEDAAFWNDEGAVTTAGRSPLPALMQQYALLAVAGAAATGAGLAAAGSRALQAAGGKRSAELDAHDPGLQPVLQLLHLDSGLLPPLLAALGNLPASTPADGAIAAAPGQPPAGPTLPAAAAAAAAAAGAAVGGAGGGSDEAALQAATGALSVLAAVLADPLLRPAVLEAERPVQRLIDATVEVCNPACALLHADCLFPSGVHWARNRVHMRHAAFMLGRLHEHSRDGDGTHSRCTPCRLRRRWASAHWLGINTSSC